MRRLCAIILVLVALVLVAVVLLVRPAMARTPYCFTYEEPALRRLQTLCNDGMRAVSTYNKTLRRWESTITTPPLGQTCRGRVNPTSRQWEGRYR
jgi:hypothetical protein